MNSAEKDVLGWNPRGRRRPKRSFITYRNLKTTKTAGYEYNLIVMLHVLIGTNFNMHLNENKI